MIFKDKMVAVTGGAQGIGKCIAECFAREGATVHVIDIKDGPWFVGDLSDKATLERFAADVIAKSGHVDVLVNNAIPLFSKASTNARTRTLHTRKPLVLSRRFTSQNSLRIILPKVRPSSISHLRVIG